MSRFLIINADDFGYSYSINKGVIEAIENGIVTSTSIMVDAIAADEAKDLTKYPNLSIGLHFELKEVEACAFQQQSLVSFDVIADNLTSSR